MRRTLLTLEVRQLQMGINPRSATDLGVGVEAKKSRQLCRTKDVDLLAQIVPADQLHISMDKNAGGSASDQVEKGGGTCLLNGRIPTAQANQVKSVSTADK